MKKRLRFSPDLVPLVLSGEKYSTWRLFDDKDLTEDDTLDLLDSKTNMQFATARIIKVVEKPLGDLTDKDRKGHEQFNSEEEMYATYSRYYQKEIKPKDLVKIIWFQLIK